MDVVFRRDSMMGHKWSRSQEQCNEDGSVESEGVAISWLSQGMDGVSSWFREPDQNGGQGTSYTTLGEHVVPVEWCV